MDRPQLYGWAFSNYVRAVRILFLEKNVDYDFETVTFQDLAVDDFSQLHPFRRVPVLVHDHKIIYESQAILHYIDESFDGGSFQPKTPLERARMHQWMSVTVSYIQPIAIGQIFVQRVYIPENGGQADEGTIKRAIIAIASHLDVLETALTQAYLVGDSITLADIFMAPVLLSMNLAPEGEQLINSRPPIKSWLDRLAKRPSFIETTVPVPKFGLQLVA
ncbi:MAG: glutathione S-transferase family protein [Nostoc sp. CreGUA01]|nr:glutathione S-transferase family protein [Nostoc sp. CreGUA01]